ncbi:Trans-1,2-dihydrobenzene-1,2-diol dehydrogenase [Clostridium sp. DL-VIII]|uniref:Gfo/Idh/MocA family protein n=1 Tax=Clostridium sp. DL-VIII TaxID=641107 RepID=UPI00023B00D9|nr:Gfo/Idh/MocA family oxidoreductase [Clostridium sp. DL-VIII]EHI99194.1 Trans-1,2-dihydrobenzene-1,2-diol dehydrogenase [Clostridium sp. DL-VIII]
MRKIKWGIIGLGNIANKFAQTVKAMDSVELEAVASRNKEKSEAFGKVYDVSSKKCFGSYEELVEDESIEAIYIAVPHVFHKELSILCLKNGKSVLCEKPVTMNGDEIREVINVAEENKVFFMEAMKTRFLPINQKVKSWIKEGRIGEVRLLQADYGFDAPFDPESRLFNKDLGGGALLDVGIYNVSYSSFIFGNHPKSIRSNLHIGKTGVDECVSINLGYEEGKQAQLYGAINLNTIREANIIGTKGRICVPKFSNADTAYIFIDGKEGKIQMPFDINGFEYQIEEVIKCMNEGKVQSESMSWKDSIEIMTIMDVARNSQ